MCVIYSAGKIFKVFYFFVQFVKNVRLFYRICGIATGGAVDEVFIPVSMELLATSGAEQFINYLKDIARTLGKTAEITLIIPTMYDPRRKVSNEVLKILDKLGPRVTKPIRVDTLLSEAPGYGKTIYEYAPRSRGQNQSTTEQ